MNHALPLKLMAGFVAVGAALSACAPPSYFQGAWYLHGISMKVDAAGNGNLSYRIYSWCGPGVIGPCDRIVGNMILDGGHATFKLTSAPTARTGTGTITSGNQLRVGGRVTLVPVLTSGGKPTVINATGVSPRTMGSLTFCGPVYVPACGA